VIRFGQFASQQGAKEGRTKPETFDFLGLTHICSVDRQGRPKLLRQTARKKRSNKLRELRTEMRARKHDPVPEQHAWLCSVLHGHDQYYGVPGNYRALAGMRHELRRFWHKQLQRRSQRGGWTVAKTRLHDE